MNQPQQPDVATDLRALCPPAINDILDEQTPGPASSSFRNLTRRAVVQVLQWDGEKQLAVSVVNEHQANTLREVSRVLCRMMNERVQQFPAVRP